MASTAAVASPPPAPRLGDLVAELDDPARRRSLEPAPADELGRVARDEEPGPPFAAVGVRGKGVARRPQRLGERRPAGHDAVTERRREGVVARERGVHQLHRGADQPDHGERA
jgi:hypothetical protein